MKKTIIIILILFFSCYGISFAQSNSDYGNIYDLSGLKPTTCELNSLYLDIANQQTETNLRGSGKLQPIILIARPGIKDKKKGLNTLIERRLHTASAYLVDYLEKQTKESVITAQAPNRGSEYGVIEIYVSGMFQEVLVQRPNAVVPIGSCDSADDAESRAKQALLYPWLYNSKSQKNVKDKSEK